MKQVVVILLVLVIPYVVGAQQLLFEKEIERSEEFKNIREAYPIVSTDSSLSVFFVDRQEIRGLRLNNNYNITGEIQGSRLTGFPELLGNNTSKPGYNLFFSNAQHDEFCAVSFDYASGTSNKAALNLKLKKERYLGSISYGGKYYILTCLKPTSTLKLYIFGDYAMFTEKTYDFGEHKFSSGNFPELYYVLDVNKPVEIDNTVPNSLDITYHKSKLYCNDNMIILTLDNQPSRTSVITIDLRTFQQTIKFYKKDKIDCGTIGEITSNSYVHENKLYQMKVCLNAMSLLITDLSTDSLLVRYNIAKDEDLFFRNSSMAKNDRELLRTKQFLRNVSESNSAISAYHGRDAIQLLVGSYKEVKIETSSPAGSGSTSIPTPYGPVVVPTNNPTLNGFRSYYSRKIHTSFSSLLDTTTFKHKEGLARDLAFDKMENLAKEIDGKYSAETAFRWNDWLVYGYYLKSEKKYYLRGFMN